jgi:hypothetical protein
MNPAMSGPAAMHLMKSDEAFHYARAVIRDDKGDLAQRRGIIGAPQWMPGGVLYRYDFLDKWTCLTSMSPPARVWKTYISAPKP